MALRAQALVAKPGVSIVPVGLSYDEKGQFRSRALMELGAPIAVSAFTDGPSEAAATRALTRAIHDAMLDVTLNFENRDLARLIGRAAELWETPHPTLLDQPALSVTAERRRDFGQRYEWLRAHHPQKTAQAWDTFAAYDSALRRHNLRDVHIGSKATASDWRWLLLSSGCGLLLRLPIAAAGLALNFATFVSVQIMSLRRDPDKRATWQVFPTIALAPFFWCLQGAIAGWYFGWGVGFLTAIAGPATTPITLGFLDSANRLFHDLRAWRSFRKDTTLSQRLLDMRQNSVRQLKDLATLVEDAPEPDQD